MRSDQLSRERRNATGTRDGEDRVGTITISSASALCGFYWMNHRIPPVCAYNSALLVPGPGYPEF
eukprot:2258792-Rhodomonas_salina.1